MKYLYDLETKEQHIIFSDSQTAISRIKSGKIKTSLKQNSQTKKLLIDIENAKTRLKTHDTSHIEIQKRETKSQ